MWSIKLDESASLHDRIFLRSHHPESLIEVNSLRVFLIDIQGESQWVFIEEIADKLSPDALPLALDSHSDAHQITGAFLITIQVTSITHNTLSFCLARHANTIRGRFPKLLQNVGVLFEKL